MLSIVGLRRVGSGERLTYGDGEHRLTEWMAAHMRVAWTVVDEPWVLEKRLIHDLVLPLNLDQNAHPFRSTLSGLRSAQRLAARSAPFTTASLAIPSAVDPPLGE